MFSGCALEESIRLSSDHDVRLRCSVCATHIGKSMAEFQAASDTVPDADVEESGYYSLAQLKRQYYDYLGVKPDEIEEAKQSRRYYHGAQWTETEVKALKKRRQPVITSNRIVRKIDAVVGLVERLKQDPKAFPRTPKSEQGAEVATAVLRYALDHVQWTSKAPRVARMAAIDGLAGIELDMAYGDHGDPDIDLHLVYPDTFFYDPRSYDDGFTDARYMGISKWIDADQAKELVPEKADEIDDLHESGTDLTSSSDREVAWFTSTGKKLRMVDHWYIHEGHWCWCLHVGSSEIDGGHSPVRRRARQIVSASFSCSRAAVDHDGDRYGFVTKLQRTAGRDQSSSVQGAAHSQLEETDPRQGRGRRRREDAHRVGAAGWCGRGQSGQEGDPGRSADRLRRATADAAGGKDRN